MGPRKGDRNLTAMPCADQMSDAIANKKKYQVVRDFVERALVAVLTNSPE
jgi:hypothetical protein